MKNRFYMHEFKYHDGECLKRLRYAFFYVQNRKRKMIPPYIQVFCP